jgi:hypothetical protein
MKKAKLHLRKGTPVFRVPETNGRYKKRQKGTENKQ